MNVIKNRDLEKEEKNLREGFYGTGIQFYRKGDGIDTPIKMIIGFPSIRGDSDEVERIRQFIFENHSFVYIVLIMLDAFLAFNVAKELSDFEKESEILKNILEKGDERC